MRRYNFGVRWNQDEKPRTDISNFLKSGLFLFKFNIVPTLCNKFSFNTYIGQTLQFNLMNLTFMPGSAVLLFYRILKHGSVDFCVFIC